MQTLSIQGKSIQTSVAPEEINEVNHLFKRLINNDSFLEECKERWFYLRNVLWTEEFILNMISDNYEQIKDLLELEKDLWYSDNNDEDLINNAIIDLYDWIPKRIEFCDHYFSGL